tara:strand:- start:37521 stop:38183 length:663 start_codon:yes stop_codon:yes gene_type:complete
MNAHLKKYEIENLDTFYRANLINSIVGIKQANLIGTISKSGITNLAIFSSVVHLGSNPALIGFFNRPVSSPPKQTLNNILETRHFSINHVSHSIVKRAHATSYKFQNSESEFKECNLTELFINGFETPFVKESIVSIGLSFKNKYLIAENGVIMIIGEVQHIIIKNRNYINDNGEVDIEKSNSVGVTGNNSYYKCLNFIKNEYIKSGDTSMLKSMINEEK